MTAPIVLPDYGAQLAEALARLGRGVRDIAAPHAEERIAFRKAAAANPAILQNLRDLAEIQGYTPTFEALKNLVPQDLLDVITSLEPSPEARIRKAGARAVEQAEPETLTALGMADILKLPPAEAARQLALAPAIPRVAELPPGEVGPTAAERGAARFVGGEFPEEAAAGVVQGDLVKLAGQHISALSPERKAELGAYQALPTLMADEHFMKQLALQERMFEARNRDRISDMMTRLAEQNIIWWQQNTGIGTTDGWREFFSEKGRKRLEALSGEDPRKPVSSLTAQDRELLEIQRAFQAAPAEKRALDLSRVDTAIGRLRVAIDKERSTSTRAGFIVALNQQLLNKARITGAAPMHAAWAPAEVPTALEPVMGGLIRQTTRKLRFYDDKNNEVSPESIEALSVVEPQSTRGAPSGGEGTPFAPPPRVPSAQPGPTRVTPQARWNQLRAEMFPNVPPGRLTADQIRAVTARVNAELAP